MKLKQMAEVLIGANLSPILEYTCNWLAVDSMTYLDKVSTTIIKIYDNLVWNLTKIQFPVGEILTIQSQRKFAPCGICKISLWFCHLSLGNQ